MIYVMDAVVIAKGLVRCITESLQAIAFYVRAVNFYIDFTF